MNRTFAILHVLILFGFLSCKKEKELATLPVSVRMYGFGVAEDHEVFRFGELLHIVQPISVGKWEIRSINLLTQMQESVGTIDVLRDVNIEATKLIGTSDFILLENGNYVKAVLYRSEDAIHLQVLKWNHDLRLLGITQSRQMGEHMSFTPSAPALNISSNELTVVFGTAKQGKFDLKIQRYDVDSLNYLNGITLSHYTEEFVDMIEGTELRMAMTPDQLILFCNIPNGRIISAPRFQAQFGELSSMALSDLGIVRLKDLILWGDSIYASSEKIDFAGIVSLTSGREFGVSNNHRPVLQYARILGNQLILSIQSIPTNAAIPDFSSIQTYDAAQNITEAIEPENIPVRTPRYIYAAPESDGAHILLGLTPNNQAFIMKVDNNGKMISF